MIEIPAVGPSDDTLSAARAYAAAGAYVLPVRPTDRKNPGSRVGKDWPSKSSRDPDQLAAWFAGTSDLLAIHCGRSGLVVADLDRPDAIPPALVRAIAECSPPMQTSRPDQPGRAHFVFRTPPDRLLGNGTGGLGRDWGEIRGLNGVIIVAPSVHAAAAEGAAYRWSRTGPVPVLPDYVAELLPSTERTADAAPDAVVAQFVARHTASTSRGSLDGPVRVLRAALSGGQSRHGALVDAACWVAREALIGLYPAREAFDAITVEFVQAMGRSPLRAGDRVLAEPAARHEAEGVVAWAVGQALAEGVAGVRDRRQQQATDGLSNLVALAGGPVPVAGGVAAVAPAVTLAPAPPDPVTALLDEMIDTDGLDDIEPLSPVVEGWLFEDSVARVIGASGHGKSFATLGLAACVATGTPWHGHAVTTGPAVYVVAEGARGVRARVRAWEQVAGVKATGLRFLARPIQTSGPEWPVLVEACRRIGPRLVVVDTQARVTVGIDENDNSAMGAALVDQCERLRAATGACVLLVHHRGLNGEQGRGASAVKAALQTELAVTKRRDVVIISAEKQKDTEERAPLTLQLAPVEIGRDPLGFAVTSAALVLADAGRAKAVAVDQFGNESTAVLASVIRDVFASGVGTATKAEIRSVTIDERRLMSKAGFYRSWNALVAAGSLSQVEGARGQWRWLEGTDDE